MKKHIYVYSPSSAVRDRAAFRRGIARLRSQGHAVEIDPSALATDMRFAGDDATRLQAIARAAASGADVALTSRGGYGLTRILPEVDYKALAKAVDRGTSFVGLSDFTALQSALLARTGRISWAGPALGEDFGAVEPDDIMEACFDDLLQRRGEGGGWRLPAEKTLPSGAVPLDGFEARKAVLWGGNLAVLVSLLGTPYFPEVKGGVLFLEDVNEHPFRIERMLTQLLHAGVLARQKALVLGQFSNYRLAPHDKGFKLRTVVDRLRGLLKIPVLSNLPFGHVPSKLVLPVGAPVTVSVSGRDAFLLWGHLH